MRGMRRIVRLVSLLMAPIMGFGVYYYVRYVAFAPINEMIEASKPVTGPQRIEVHVTGLDDLHFEGTIRSAGGESQKVKGKVPASFSLVTDGRKTVNVRLKKTDPHGPLNVSIMRGGKEIGRGTTSAQFGTVHAAGF